MEREVRDEKARNWKGTRGRGLIVEFLGEFRAMYNYHSKAEFPEKRLARTEIYNYSYTSV